MSSPRKLFLSYPYLFDSLHVLARSLAPALVALSLLPHASKCIAPPVFRAFKALAYKRYQHVPIYLEWAPANIFRADAPKAGALTRLAPSAPAAQLANAPAAADVAGNAAETGAAAAAAVLPEVEDNDTSTIYVKNLAFATGNLLELLNVVSAIGCCHIMQLT